jgi:AT-rich interactive domain-containing protein 1
MDKEQIKSENCFTNSQTNEWDFDSDDSDSSSELDDCSMKGSSSQTNKNDSCLSTIEDFTAKLKKELDLDIELLPEESETNSYIKSIIETKVERSKNSPVEEEESVRKEDAPLSLRTESDDAISRRCMCVSNILRGLSFVPGNDVEMFKHSGLLLILGKLLLLCHKHAKRVPYRHSYMQDDVEVDAPSDDRDDWWWHSLEVLRENALVILSNIAGQLDLTVYPKTIATPILDGLLHWFVCRSAEAIDPMPTATFGTSLSAQQLVLEALAKMSILGGNAELILTMPPPSRLEALYATLVRLLGQRENPVTRELTLVVLSNLSQSDNNFVCLVEKKQCIAMLLQFIEDAANSINAYSSGGSLAQAGFHSEDFCGTSVDMLRRAASSLVCLARCKPIRSLFLPYQERLLLLTTLKLLERMIGSQLADVLYYLSR